MYGPGYNNQLYRFWGASRVYLPGGYMHSSGGGRCWVARHVVGDSNVGGRGWVVRHVVGYSIEIQRDHIDTWHGVLLWQVPFCCEGLLPAPWNGSDLLPPLSGGMSQARHR